MANELTPKLAPEISYQVDALAGPTWVTVHPSCRDLEHARELAEELMRKLPVPVRIHIMEVTRSVIEVKVVG